MDPPEGLELGEAAVVGRHHDVAGQHQLDAEGVGDALHGGHDRLGAASPQGHRVDPFALGGAQPILHSVAEPGQVQPGCEVRTVAEQHTAPEVVVLMEPFEGGHKLAGHLRRVTVHLGGPIQAHQEDPTADLGRDAAVGGVEWSFVAHGVLTAGRYRNSAGPATGRTNQAAALTASRSRRRSLMGRPKA